VTSFGQIEHAWLTDVGVRPDHNQDSYAIQLAGDEEGWRHRGHLFLVADGWGSPRAGEIASDLAARIIPSNYRQHARKGPAQALRSAFGEANASIHERTRELGGMGTTSTVLLLRSDGVWVGHVGDTRCYRIRGDVIEQLSYDHSLVWEYAACITLIPTRSRTFPATSSTAAWAGAACAGGHRGAARG
jgi:protein phosphatase